MENGLSVTKENGIESITYTDSLATIVVGSGTYYFTTGSIDVSDYIQNTDHQDMITSSIYDINGCKFDQKEITGLSHGIYIINGTKRIVK